MPPSLKPLLSAPPQPTTGELRKIGTPTHFRWLAWIVVVIFALNVFDALMTIHWVLSGQANEANPLMDHVLEDSPGLFMVIKLGLVGLGSWLLWRLRHRAGAVIGIFLLFVVYYVLFLYHLAALELGLLSRLLS
jgi:hypothetical protein